VATAAPSGFANFGNAQPSNALTAAGYNVQINGATVFPLSRCKVIQVEGLNNSNIDSDGKRIDSTKFDTVYVGRILPGRVIRVTGALVRPGPEVASDERKVLE